MTGMALYEPMATRKSAAYCVCGLLCTVRSIANPEMATEIGIRVKANRCLALSEKNATIIAKTKAHAHGGTLCSWVPIGVYP